MSRKVLTSIWLMVPAFVLVVLFIYVPVVKGISNAFQHYNLIDLSDTSFSGFANFRSVILDPNVSFGRILLNTFVWVVASLVLQFILGFTLALLMRNPFPGRGLYSGFVFYTWALSGFAIGLVWSWLLNGQFGVVNDALMRVGLIKHQVPFLSSPRFAMISVIVTNVWYGIPFFAIMLLSARFSRFPTSSTSLPGSMAQESAAALSVTIPYVMPTIVSTTLLRTMWIMNFPEIIYGMTNGGPGQRHQRACHSDDQQDLQRVRLRARLGARSDHHGHPLHLRIRVCECILPKREIQV